MSEYYVGKPGENPTGPFTEDALRKGLEDGSFPAESKAWKEGMDSWKTLAELFGDVKDANPSPVTVVQQVFVPVVESLPESAKPASAAPSKPVKKKRRVKKRSVNVPPVEPLTETRQHPFAGQKWLLLVGILLIVGGIFIICIPDVFNQYLHLW